MFISGSIGYIKLKNYNNNKNIYLFLDNHNNTNYCNNSNKLFLDNFIKKFVLNNSNFCNKKKCNLNIFLEELLKDNNNMLSLFKNSKHINKFFKFYKNILKKQYEQYVYPFDIRQFLQIIDIVLIMDNNNNNNIKLLNCKYLFYYINILLNLNLDLNDIDFNLIDINIINNINDIKKQFIKIYNNPYLIIHYKLLITNTLKLYKKCNKSIKDCSEELLMEFSYLIDNIMEFYCILLIITNFETEIIIYAGAYHCLNIANQLINNYKYKLKYNSTTIDIKNLPKDHSFLEKLEKYDNCIEI